ncbi:MAG: hypothetical protein E7331_07065 [Clostridiales bacterium]|nr:hypothetical protein [Clostridiales bacterium]
MKKENIEIVEKPYLKGSWYGKDALKLIPKKFFGMLGIVLLYFLGGLLLNLGSLFGTILPMTCLVVVVAVYQFNKGQDHGASDVAFGEILYGQQEQGKSIVPSDRERCYHPFKGFFVALLAALPFVVVAAVYAFMAKKAYYTLGTLPSFMDGMMQQDEFAGALNYYVQREPLAALDVLRVIVRGMCMPLISVMTQLGDNAVLVAERLTPLFLLIAPLCYGFGYFSGPSVRTKINTGIKIGVEKKLKKQRKERRKRQRSNTPERLI